MDVGMDYVGVEVGYRQIKLDRISRIFYRIQL